MRIQSKRILVFAAFVSLLLVLFNEFKRGREYRVGMTMVEVQALTGDRYPIKKMAYDYGDDGPTQAQLERDTPYYIYDEHDGILLLFNHQQRLSKKVRIKWFGVNVGEGIDSFR